ncbi:hypothetical protein [Campylobacter sp. FOBRC14]|jgi:hypothetical protein cfetvA_16820|uniref:hypothetical protein n=1 Tax=Campylobacter sp. FOBRC14 TaxID=936554 RepID=UPI00027A3641|nr:hypothetical protein [Campylobacter sp. FOBRC14]EJP76062.1 hypothetical protein HMPREF1139_2001 [Campylobacter sp. FOBRC14]
MQVKINKKEFSLSDKELSRAVEDFCEVKSQIDVLNESLKTHKDVIVAKARELLNDDEATTINFIDDKDGVKVSFGWNIEVSDVSALMTLLGPNFNLLVRTDTTYKPEKKLKELALNDDGLKQCLDIKEKSPSVSVI